MSVPARQWWAMAATLGFGASATMLARLLGADATQALATGVLFSLLAALAWWDAVTETVPDALTLSLVATGLAYTAQGDGAVLPHLGGATLLLGLGALQDMIAPDRGWIGAGDMFLFAGVLAWLGPAALIDVAMIMSVGLGLHAIIARRTTIALAPSLAVATGLIWLGGPIL